LTVDAKRVVEAGNELRAEAERRVIPYKDGGMTLDGMDCQGALEYLLIQCGMSKSEVNKAGTNEHIRKSAKWFGTIEECVALFGIVPPGAWIYIWTPGYNEKYDDQLGNASHMGQLLDDGEVLHASASRGRVLLSDNRVLKKSIPNGGWNAVLLPRYIRFSNDVEQKLGNIINDGEGSETMSLVNKTCVVTGGDLKLRPNKSVNGVWLAVMPEGAEVTVTADDGTWATVAYFDQKRGKMIGGYAKSEYLAEKAAGTAAETETAANAGTPAAAESAASVVVTGSGGWIPTPTPAAAVSLGAILKNAVVKQA
jgi:hypothetical protein